MKHQINNRNQPWSFTRRWRIDTDCPERAETEQIMLYERGCWKSWNMRNLSYVAENLCPNHKSMKRMGGKANFFFLLVNWFSLAPPKKRMLLVEESGQPAGCWPTEADSRRYVWYTIGNLQRKLKGHFSLALWRHRNAQPHNKLQRTWNPEPSPLPGGGNPSDDTSWRQAASCLLGLRLCFIFAPFEGVGIPVKIKRECWTGKILKGNSRIYSKAEGQCLSQKVFKKGKGEMYLRK